MKPKLLIEIRGGSVVRTAANQDINIVIIDWDEIPENKPACEIEVYKPNNISENFYELYTDAADPVEMEIRDCVEKCSSLKN